MEEATQEQLEQFVAEWQKRLRLQDWEVEAEWKRAHRAGDLLASITPRTDHKSADMWIACPEDFDEDNTYQRDWQHAVVHELLHLHWHFLGTDHPQLPLIEQAIELTSLALIRLWREKHGDEA